MSVRLCVRLCIGSEVFGPSELASLDVADLVGQGMTPGKRAFLKKAAAMAAERERAAATPPASGVMSPARGSSSNDALGALRDALLKKARCAARRVTRCAAAASLLAG